MGNLCGFAIAKVPSEINSECNYELQPLHVAFSVYEWGGNQWECRCSARWMPSPVTPQEQGDGVLEAWHIINSYAVTLCLDIWGGRYECPHCHAIWLRQ